MRPGIPERNSSWTAHADRTFNEAQAMRPGIRYRNCLIWIVSDTFNEAQAMRPGILLDEYEVEAGYEYLQ